jgi:hypothetical protein
LSPHFQLVVVRLRLEAALPAKKSAQDRAQKWREERKAEAEFYRQIKAAADREAQRQELVRVAIGAGAFLAFLIFIWVAMVVALGGGAQVRPWHGHARLGYVPADLFE